MLLLRFATAMSALPSPLKSAMTTECGALPTATEVGAWNVPSPLPISTLMLETLVHATANIGLAVVVQIADGDFVRARADAVSVLAWNPDAEFLKTLIVLASGLR